MNILETILNAQGGASAQELGRQFGLNGNQTRSALEALLPALAGAINQNTQATGGLDALLGALNRGQHGRYLDDPSLLGRSETVADGNGILGHIFGSKEVSREVAAQAAGQTGIGSEVLKKMLPVVAAMVMSGLARKAMAGRGAGAASAGQMPGGGLGAGLGSGAGAGSGGLMDLLTPMLDGNRNGSALDDILRMAAGALMRR